MEAFDKQYMLKQSIYYYFLTKLHLMVIFAVFFISGSMTNFFLIYPIAVMVTYRFLYNETKLENPYNTYLMAKFISIIRQIRNKND